MANEYLISKWKLWYKSLDVNHDGNVTKADADDCGNKLLEMSSLDSDKAKAMKDTVTAWWTKFILRGSSEMSEADFVESLNSDLKADKEKFKDEMKNCFEFILNAFDTNKDRSFSKEEYAIAFKAYGHENIAQGEGFFQRYGPVDGQVPLGNIVDAWVQFVTSEDSSQNDIVKEGLESGL